MYRKECFVFLMLAMSSSLYICLYVIQNNSKEEKYFYHRLEFDPPVEDVQLFTRNTEEIEQYLRVNFMNKILQEPREPFIFTITPWKVNASQQLFSNSSNRVVRWSMVTIMKSTPGNTERRKIARETWASYNYIDGTRFETIFIVGNNKTKEEQEILLHENATYGDILQMSLEEEYKNIVYKSLAAMQYAGDNFPPEWIFSSADDDVLPDLYTMKERITEMLKSVTEPKNDCKFTDHVPVFCAFDFVPKPMTQRTKKSKWSLSQEEYPVSSFPSCCRGAWYSMSVGKAKAFYRLSEKLDVFWVEDLFVTSFLRLRYYDSIKSDCALSDPAVGIWKTYKKEILAMHQGNQTQKWIEFQKKINTTDSLRDKWMEL